MNIKVRNEQLAGTRWKKQNNVLRMVLFYGACAMVVILASYGGLIFTKSNLKGGIADSDPAMLQAAINFEKVNRTLKSQMPGILDANAAAKADSKYMASADVKYVGPLLVAGVDNVASLLEKGGMITKRADGGIDYSQLDTSFETMSYSRVSVKVVNQADPDLWLLLNIQKDESLIQWRVTGAFMSERLRDRVLE